MSKKRSRQSCGIRDRLRGGPTAVQVPDTYCENQKVHQRYAALTLLVLTEVMRHGSMLIGFGHLLVFGAGSIGGMHVTSGLIGLPFSLRSRFFEQSICPLRALAGFAGTVFGFLYAWQTFRMF